MIVGQGCINLPAPRDVLELLEILEQRYPDFQGLLLNDDHTDKGRDAIVLVCGRHIEHLDGVRTPLSEQDYVAERRYALAAMQDMQHAFNYIPEKGLHCLAKHLNCGVAQLYSMATFYKALSLKPKGKHIIKICNGTACHIRGSVNLAAGLKRELGIDPGETTEDGMFSVEMVNCLGSCALAPVMLVDGTYHNKLKLEDVPGIVERYRRADVEEGEAGND